MSTITLPEKFQTMQDEMNTRLVERTRETQTAVTGLVGGLHTFYLGPPGTGKSLTVRTLHSLIDDMPAGSYFEWLLTRFTNPSELFGPPMLSQLKQDIYRFNTDGKLPTARLAFLDEIWKGNSSILNALLPVINEGIFFNNVPEAVDIILYTASNELPQGDELAAMYDRIHFRHLVKPIQEQGNFIQMLKLQMAGPVVPVVTWDEVMQARKEVAEVEVPDDVLEAINTLRGTLRGLGIEPTDRRWGSTLKVAKATAWLAGRQSADIDDLRLLRNMLWDDPKDAPQVERTVLELANPLDKEAMDLLETIEKLASELDEVLRESDNKQVRNKKGIELHGKLERAKADLDAIKKRANKAGRKSDVIKQAHDRLLGVTTTLLKEIFRIDAKNLEAENE